MERPISPFTIWRRARRVSATQCLPGSAASRKSLPCKFFYDERGSALFEEICKVPEYYLTRTEIAILERVCRRDRRAARPALPADRTRQRRQHQGAHPAPGARQTGSLCAGGHFARASARGRGPARGRFSRPAGDRSVRRLHAAVPAAAAARRRRASASGFFRARRSAISSRRRSCVSCATAPNCSAPAARC